MKLETLKRLKLLLKKSKTTPLFELNETLDSKTLMEFKCSCGTIFKRNSSNLLKKQNCRNCLMKLSGKVPILDNFNLVLKNSNCEYLSKIQVKDRNQELNFKCSCGNKFTKKLYLFLKSQICQKCIKINTSKFNTLTKNKTYNKFLNVLNESKCKVLFKHKNPITIVESRKQKQFICFCGNKFTKSIFAFLSSPRCKNCSKLKNRNSQNLVPFEKLKKFISKSELITTEKEYKESLAKDFKLTLKCGCGVIFKKPLTDYAKDPICKNCSFKLVGNNKRFTYEFYKTKIEDLNCKIITSKKKFQKSYINSSKKCEIKIQCSCGNIISDFLHKILRLNKLRIKNNCFCKVKSRVTSVFELEIREFIQNKLLEKLIINSRKIIDPYELDIFIESKNIAFECNGDYFHMNPEFYSQNDKNKLTSEKAVDIWNKDKMKIKLAKSKGIKLITILENDLTNKNKQTKQKILKILNI